MPNNYRLVRRKPSGIYHCRVVVPRHLVTRLGKREIHKSLKTSDYAKARQLVKLESLKIDYEISKLEGYTHQGIERLINEAHTSQAPAARPPLPSTKTLTFAELVELYRLAPERQNLSPKTVLDQRGAFLLLSELIGASTLVHEITRQTCREVQQVIINLPPNAKKRFPKLNAREAAKKAKAEGIPVISPKNSNKYMGALAAIFSWAMKESLIDFNPAKGLLVPDKPVKDKRLPFDMTDLEQLFSSPEMQEYRQKGSAYFWVPILALYTGARMNELCQLELEDIMRTDAGIWYIQIKSSDTQRLKTKQSERIIPIHGDILELGFEAYVERMRKRGASRLFPEISVSRRGYASEVFSKVFSRILRQAGVSDPKKCFHSFRHNFRDALRHAEIPSDAALQLGGWSQKGAQAAYGNGYSIASLHEYVNRLQYQGFHLQGS